MSALFEECHDSPTPIGALFLRLRLDAVLADIDHAPHHLLDDRSDSFCRVQGLRTLKQRLRPGGILGLRSKKLTDGRCLDRLGAPSAKVCAEPVTVDDPLTGRPFTQTVYLARAEP